MLSSLFGKKSDHPLADIRSAQALLDDLPRNDPHKALTELTGWIESVPDNSDFKLDHQFAVLRLLDETARPYARKLALVYFTPHELSKFQENHLWLALSNWSSHTTNAYLAIFNRYCNGDKGGVAIKAQVPLLVARAVHAMTVQIKYICARYSITDSKIWSDFALLYQHAEQQQYLDTPLSLYPGMAGDASVKCELVHLLGWYGCGVDTLNPLRMHLAERIVGQYCSCMDIGIQKDASSLFYFVQSKPGAPMRVKTTNAMHPSMRFVSMAAMQPKLEILIKKLEKNIIPEEFGLSGAYGAELIREAAQHLLDYLVAPPSRRNPRRAVKAYLNVVSGFAKTVERAHAGSNPLDEKPLRWEIDNISAGGFCAVSPAQGMDGLRIGNLFGVQPDGVQHWGVAVVRRLVRNDANQLQVGAEMLANQIAGVTISQSSGSGLEAVQPALWLCAKQDDLPGEAQLLMKADSFSLRRSVQTRLNGKTYLLIPIGLRDKGTDYDLAKFRVIEQEGGLE